jgi:hypothetical protein
MVATAALNPGSVALQSKATVGYSGAFWKAEKGPNADSRFVVRADTAIKTRPGGVGVSVSVLAAANDFRGRSSAARTAPFFTGEFSSSSPPSSNPAAGETFTGALRVAVPMGRKVTYTLSRPAGYTAKLSFDHPLTTLECLSGATVAAPPATAPPPTPTPMPTVEPSSDTATAATTTATAPAATGSQKPIGEQELDKYTAQPLPSTTGGVTTAAVVLTTQPGASTETPTTTAVGGVGGVGSSTAGSGGGGGAGTVVAGVVIALFVIVAVAVAVYFRRKKAANAPSDSVQTDHDAFEYSTTALKRGYSNSVVLAPMPKPLAASKIDLASLEAGGGGIAETAFDETVGAKLEHKTLRRSGKAGGAADDSFRASTATIAATADSAGQQLWQENADVPDKTDASSAEGSDGETDGDGVDLSFFFGGADTANNDTYEVVAESLAASVPTACTLRLGCGCANCRSSRQSGRLEANVAENRRGRSDTLLTTIHGMAYCDQPEHGPGLAIRPLVDLQEESHSLFSGIQAMAGIQRGLTGSSARALAEEVPSATPEPSLPKVETNLEAAAGRPQQARSVAVAAGGPTTGSAGGDRLLVGAAGAAPIRGRSGSASSASSSASSTDSAAPLDEHNTRLLSSLAFTRSTPAAAAGGWGFGDAGAGGGAAVFKRRGGSVGVARAPPAQRCTHLANCTCPDCNGNGSGGGNNAVGSSGKTRRDSPPPAQRCTYLANCKCPDCDESSGRGGGTGGSADSGTVDSAPVQACTYLSNCKCPDCVD